MSEKPGRPPTILCLASFFKGNDFIRQCKRQGYRVFLLTRERLRDGDWARDCIDDYIIIPDKAEIETCLDLVNHFSRLTKPDLVVALEEGDVIPAARIREELCLPGMPASTARLFRDKLAMRFAARDAGLPQPEFVSLLNYQEVGEFIERIPPPWVIKPRADASSVGIKKLFEKDDVWRAKDMLDARKSVRERSSYYLLESYITGDVYHVDSLVDHGIVVFAGVNRYGAPPLDITQHGGVSTSYTLKYGSSQRRELLKANRRLLTEFGLDHGASHAEFIRSQADGRYYFVEVAARVGGAYTVEALEAATGINLWREWAKIEISDPADPYKLSLARKGFSGLAVSLAKQEHPDTSRYVDPEIVYRVDKPWHVGLIVSSPKYERVVELLDKYRHRFAEDFTAVAPQQERP